MLQFTSEETLALSSAVCCKIIQLEGYADTLKHFIDSGVECCDSLEKTEGEIKKYKDLWNKILKG